MPNTHIHRHVVLLRVTTITAAPLRRTSFRLAALSGVVLHLLTLGCTGQLDGTGPGTDPLAYEIPPTGDDQETPKTGPELIDEICAQVTTCGIAFNGYGPFADQQACAHMIASKIVPSSDDRAELDLAILEGCANALSAAQCDALKDLSNNDSIQAACGEVRGTGKVVRGTLGERECCAMRPRMGASECAPGSYCHGYSRYYGKCTKDGTLGARCLQGTCADGLYCGYDDQGEMTCMEKGDVGASCHYGNCKAGLFCNRDSICATPQDNGADCFSNDQCKSKSCSADHICTDRGSEGSECEQDYLSRRGNCDAGLVCLYTTYTEPRRCVVPAIEGETCEVDTACAAGLFCDSNSETCVKGAEAYATCTPGHRWSCLDQTLNCLGSSGNEICTDRPTTGNCSSTFQCAPGHICTYGTCQKVSACHVPS